MTYCENCGAPLGENVKFCGQCGALVNTGTKTRKYCKNCHTELEPGAIFCPECGYRVVSDPEPAPAPKPDPKPDPKPEPKPDPKPDPKPEPKPNPVPAPAPRGKKTGCLGTIVKWIFWFLIFMFILWLVTMAGK